MKTKKLLVVASIMLMIVSLFSINANASYIGIDMENDDFHFDQTTYSLRGDHDVMDITMVLPDGYTMDDVEFTIEDESVVTIGTVFSGEYYFESGEVGETAVIARIKNTNYIANCQVEVLDSILVNVMEKEVGATLVIDCTNPYVWSYNTKQAVDILVTPFGYEGEEKWIRLGEGIYGTALNKTYFYDIAEDSIVTIRYVSWWTGEYFNGEQEFLRQAVIVDGVETGFSFGARVHIYGDTNMINPWDTVQLNAGLIEISNDAEVSWRSYQDNVAVVDENGRVTGISEGETFIEATVTEVLPSGYELVYQDVYPIVVGSEISHPIYIEENCKALGIILNHEEEPTNQVKNLQANVTGKKLNLSWDKVDGAEGYEVVFEIAGTNIKWRCKFKSNNITFASFPARRSYEVSVRSYQTVNGEKQYGEFSNPVNFSIK